MKKTQCKEGLDIYKKFLTRMTRISEFLKVAEVILALNIHTGPRDIRSDCLANSAEQEVSDLT